MNEAGSYAAGAVLHGIGCIGACLHWARNALDNMRSLFDTPERHKFWDMCESLSEPEIFESLLPECCTK